MHLCICDAGKADFLASEANELFTRSELASGKDLGVPAMRRPLGDAWWGHQHGQEALENMFP